MRPIIFDLLDTLFDETSIYKKFYQKIKNKYDLEYSAQEFVDLFFSNQRKIIFENSKKTFKEICEYAFSRIINESNVIDLEILYGLHIEMEFKKGIIKLLLKLKDKYDFYILTNCSNELVEKINIQGKCPVKFKKIFTSEDIGVYKPNPVSYEKIAKFIGISKEKIIYISSNKWDQISSKKFGFNSQTIEDLKKI